MKELNKQAELEKMVSKQLEILGYDLEDEHIKDTPRRVAKMWLNELLVNDSNVPNVKVFKNPGYDEIILEKNIAFHSMCAHHMLPFEGKGHIAYIPNQKMVGISKLARILDFYSARLQVQERLTQQVCDFLWKELEPLGVAVILEATHCCMTIRGVKKPGSTLVTSAMKGAFISSASARQELLELIKK